MPKNWKSIVLIICGAIIIWSLTAVAVVYDTVIISQEAMKALIQAEATILGFFGLIIIYLLKAFDDRQEWWESTWLRIAENGKKELVKGMSTTKEEVFGGFVKALIKNRRRTVQLGSIIGTLLVFSLLISIYSLGIMGTVPEIGKNRILGYVVSWFSGLAIYSLYTAIVLLFDLFRNVPDLF